jgi:hypothetical protein
MTTTNVDVNRLEEATMKNRMESSPRVTRRPLCAMAAAALLASSLVGGGASPVAAQTPQVTAPKPAEPEIFTLEGEFVRIAYNNEGYASLGYRMANEEVGKEWVLLSVGITLRKPTKDYTLKRGSLSLQTPDGKTIALATQKEYAAANVSALNMRAKVVRDSINYFPGDASRACSLRFFSDLGGPGPAFAMDDTDLSWDRVCLGRLYFHAPGGIQVGQHFLNVQFAGSKLQVPFRTLTKEEEKILSKKWDDLKKQHEAAMKQ